MEDALNLAKEPTQDLDENQLRIRLLILNILSVEAQMEAIWGAREYNFIAALQVIVAMFMAFVATAGLFLQYRPGP